MGQNQAQGSASESVRQLPIEERRTLLVHGEAFRLLQDLQRKQTASPRFDLCDLGSALIKIVCNSPDAAEKVEKQARADFIARASSLMASR